MMDQERMETFLETLADCVPDHLRLLETEALQNHVPIIRRQTWSVLRFLIKVRNPLAILEVGTAIGYSSLLMCEAAGPECLIKTIEKVPKRIEEARKNIEKYHKERRIELIEGEAEEVLRQLAGNNEQFDLVFLDAAKGQYINFLPHLRKLLRINAMLVTDNVFMDGDVLESRFAVTRRDRTIHGRMREFLYAITKEPDWETLVLPIGDGVAVSQWKGRM